MCVSFPGLEKGPIPASLKAPYCASVCQEEQQVQPALVTRSRIDDPSSVTLSPLPTFLIGVLTPVGGTCPSTAQGGWNPVCLEKARSLSHTQQYTLLCIAPCCSDHNGIFLYKLLFNLWLPCQYINSRRARIKLLPLTEVPLRISAKPGIKKSLQEILWEKH